MNTFERISCEPLTICIDGAGGSGKSTLADNIIKAAGVAEPQLIRGDWYFEPWPQATEVSTPGFFNSDRFLEEFAGPLRRGEEPIVRELNMKTGEFIDHEPPDERKLIVVEGVKMLSIKNPWDFGVWVETPRDLRKERFMRRGVDERQSRLVDGRRLGQAFDTWADDADLYSDQVFSEQLCQVIIEGNKSPQVQLEHLARILRKGHLRRGSVRP